MIAELLAIKARIDALGISAFVGQVPPTTTLPYASLSAPGHDSPAPDVGGRDATRSSDVRVLVTHTTEANAYRALDEVRDELTPNLAPASLTVSGRHAQVDFVRSEFVMTDRDVILPGTNRHPGFGVDTYHVTSQPL